MNENSSASPVKERWKTVDEVRGLAILMLFAFNGFYSFSGTPVWLRHAPPGKYYIFDMVAPLFLFAVGLSYPLSLRKRLQRDGKVSAITHIFKRGLILILFGSLGDWLVNRNFSFHWGTLEMIGLCGIIALPAMLLSPAKRIGLGICMVILWQFLLILPGVPETMGVRYTMGGPIATICWVSAVLISSAFSEWKTILKNSEYMASIFVVGVLIALLTSGTGELFITNKQTVSAPYMLFSLELSLAIFALFYLKELRRACPFPILESLGKNALALYMVSGVINKLAITTVGSEISGFHLILIAAAQVMLNMGIGLYMDRKRIYFAL